jgi:osmotically-inducible protein OsmY
MIGCMKNQTALCALILAASLPAFAAQQLPADAVAPSETAAKMDLDAAASSVTQALKDAEGVPARGLTVATHASTLVLTGEVDTEAQRVAALSVAEKAAGGMRISSNIQVKPAQARSAKVSWPLDRPRSWSVMQQLH